MSLGSEHVEAVEEIRREIANDNDPAHEKLRNGVFMSYGSREANFEYMDAQVAQEPTNLVGGLDKTRDIQDRLCYIYTRYEKGKGK